MVKVILVSLEDGIGTQQHILSKIFFGVQLLFRVGLLCKHQQPQLPLLFCGFCSVLPIVSISYVSAVVHKSQIASFVVQAIAFYDTQPFDYFQF